MSLSSPDAPVLIWLLLKVADWGTSSSSNSITIPSLFLGFMFNILTLFEQRAPLYKTRYMLCMSETLKVAAWLMPVFTFTPHFILTLVMLQVKQFSFTDIAHADAWCSTAHRRGNSNSLLMNNTLPPFVRRSGYVHCMFQTCPWRTLFSQPLFWAGFILQEKTSQWLCRAFSGKTMQYPSC